MHLRKYLANRATVFHRTSTNRFHAESRGGVAGECLVKDKIRPESLVLRVRLRVRMRACERATPMRFACPRTRHVLSMS